MRAKKLAVGVTMFLLLYFVIFPLVAIALGEEVMAWRTLDEAKHILIPAVLIAGLATRWLMKFYQD